MNRATSTLVSQFRLQWLMLGFALLAVGFYGALELYSDHQRIINDEQNRLLTQTRVINKNLEQEIKATDTALRELISDLPAWRTSSGWSEHATRRLNALANAMPGVRTFVIVNAKGVITAANRKELVNLEVRERSYFKEVVDNPDPEKLYISPPFKSVLGVYIMGVSRMIVGKNGEFEGIVNASLDPSYFSTLLSSVNYAPDMWTSLAHSNGTLFMMTPEREGMAGKNIAQPGSFYSRHIESGLDENIMSGIVYATGEDRIMAIRTIKPQGLKTSNYFVVAAGRDRNVIFADWRKDSSVQAAIFILVSLASILALAFHQKRSRQYEVQRETSRKALQRSLDDFNDLVAQIPVGVYKYRMLAGGGSHFDYVSPRWCQLLDVDEEDIYRNSEKAFAIIHPDELEHFIQLNQDAKERFSDFEWEGRVQKMDGEIRWMHIESRPTKQDNGDILWNGILFDITEQRTLLDDLKSSNTELEQFAYVTSHDLREPLRMVSGFISLLEKRYGEKLDQDAKEFIGFAVDGVKRMDRMILDLLEYSRIGRGQVELSNVDLKEIADEALLNLKATIENAKGQVDVASALPSVTGDRGRLVRLFQNLIGNALKYHSPDRAPIIRISAKKSIRNWIISVEDNGIGMAPEHLHRIFGVFQRLHSHHQYEGTGIGLAICKKIVEQHDGQIWVESTPGQGSCFYVSLPSQSA
jgi:PAS domain S-box-containing protein